MCEAQKQQKKKQSIAFPIYCKRVLIFGISLGAACAASLNKHNRDNNIIITQIVAFKSVWKKTHSKWFKSIKYTLKAHKCRKWSGREREWIKSYCVFFAICHSVAEKWKHCNWFGTILTQSTLTFYYQHTISAQFFRCSATNFIKTTHNRINEQE